MPIAELTQKEIVSHIDIELGGSQITVDLLEDDYDHIIKDGLRQLGTLMPVTRHGVVHVTSSVQKYQLDAGTWGRGIVKIDRPWPTSPLYRAWPFPDPWILSIPLHFIGDYTLQLVKMKEAEWLYGADFDWSFDTNDGILLLRPPPLEGGNFVYQYLDNPELKEVKGRQQWLLDFCLASAKRIQGSKWRKFANYPGNENQVELLTAIYEEGTEERRELLEALQSAGNAMVPPILTHRRG